MDYESILDQKAYRILADGEDRFVVVHDSYEDCPVFETEQQAKEYIKWLTAPNRPCDARRR